MEVFVVNFYVILIITIVSLICFALLCNRNFKSDKISNDITIIIGLLAVSDVIILINAI